MSYREIRALPILGEQILAKLLGAPLSLLDPLLLNQWLIANNAPTELKFNADHPIRLNNWIEVLSPIEKNRFYYSIARVQTQVRYKKKSLGPLAPIGNAAALIALGGGMIAGGAIGGIGLGAIGGVAVTSDLMDSTRSPVASGLTMMVGGPILTLGGATLTGIAGTLAGGTIATVLVLGAASELTFGVAKSIVLWPTTPFEVNRSNNLATISQMLFEFSKLLNSVGEFDAQKLVQVSTNPNLMGEALYSLYLDLHSECLRMASQSVNSDDSELSVNAKAVSLFLSSFKDLVNNLYFLPNDKLVYRKIKHIKSLMLLHMGCPNRPYEKIASNAGPSYTSEWIKSWEKKFAEIEKKRADDSPLGRAQQFASTTTSNVFR